MKLRGSGKKRQKFEPQMAPLIDIVFLLLVFFLLTFQIRAHEGDFQIHMPKAKSPGTICVPPALIPNVNVHLRANEDGSLNDVVFRRERLGVGEQAFQKLNKKVRDMVGYRAGHEPLIKDLDIEIHADSNLHYRYAVKALSACSGTLEKTADGESQRVPLVEHVRFAPPQ